MNERARPCLPWRSALPLVALALLACKGEREPAAAPLEEEAPVLEDCTWETPLEAGIPGSPGHLIPSPRNPNGHSELAALMRLMQEDMLATRAAIAEGRPIGALPEHHRRMRCAWPTDMRDRNAAFDAFAVNYMAQLEALHAAEPADRATRYGHVLAACKTCHESSCPGPLMAIEALSLDRL